VFNLGVMNDKQKRTMMIECKQGRWNQKPSFSDDEVMLILGACSGVVVMVAIVVWVVCTI